MVDDILGSFLRSMLPIGYYIPGLGLILTILIIYLFGWMLENFITQRVLSSAQKILTQVPFIRTIYSPLKDLMNLFANSDKNGMKNVVLVEAQDGIQILGLMTRDQFEDIQTGNITDFENKVAVYIPLSYALGGYTVLVPKNKIKLIDIPTEKAMSLAITGWVKTEKSAD